jgi:hypothetical protein
VKQRAYQVRFRGNNRAKRPKRDFLPIWHPGAGGNPNWGDAETGEIERMEVEWLGRGRKSKKVARTVVNLQYWPINEKYSSSSEYPKIFMLEILQIQGAQIDAARSFVRAYPEGYLSDFGFSAESHFWSISKTESLFATE